ncbi:MAG TPA: hypothetical protein VFT98_09335 [Myxococcota bacterium]|nr:hypothetical protein [Myxococcota bacterium]
MQHLSRELQSGAGGTAVAFSRGMKSLALALGISLAAAAEAQEFAPLAGFERVRGAVAVVADGEGARVAVGTASSVWVGAAGAPAARALRVGVVRDLAFGPEGALWVASDRGVFSWDGAGARPHALGPGASGRATRLLWLGDELIAGAEDGIALRPPGGAFARVNGAAPEGAVQALAALGPREWLAIIGDEIARFTLGAGARDVAEIAPELLPAGDGAPLDLARLASGEVLALRERGLAQRSAQGSWRRVALTLPPGAEPARILASARGVWIATNAGALFARDAAGPYERAASPAGAASVAALALRGDDVLLAGPRGVLHGRERARLPAARDEARAKVAAIAPGEPSVLAVQRAALRYLALEPARIASLRERTRRSALAPVLEVFGGYGGDSASDRDWDEAFTSGEDRTFFDRHRERGRDFDAGARLTWNLGAAVYHPEEIDASREAREWIELRDEVLDEIGQLYFERRRALLDAAREPDPHAAARLALRADELAAGLDAWTGGWWSARLASSSPESPAMEATP